MANRKLFDHIDTNIISAAKFELALRAMTELKVRKARGDLKSFIRLLNDNYLCGWVHAEICQRLMDFFDAIEKKQSPRLIICLPPRSGKSEIVSRNFPAWCLGKNPDFTIIATSYGADLTRSFNRDVQRIIDSELYRRVFPKTQLYSKETMHHADHFYSRTADYFEIINSKGYYKSAGVGGGITGAGCDCLIIDDPIKDREEANSQTIRNKIYDWYTSTAYTRLSPGGGVIVMCTRWHLDDLAGRLIEAGKSGGDNFEIITYPAIAIEDEPHRKKGDALHPERFSLDELEARRKAIGPNDWAALYQQNPVPEGGAVFRIDSIRFYDARSLPPRFDRIVGSWDMSFKDNKTSDFVVGQIWGRHGADFYLLDQARGRWDFSKTLEVFKNLYARWGDRCRRWLIEDKANGSAIISVLKKNIPGIIPITPKESKVARASAVTTFFEAGNVHLPRESNFTNALIDEIATFPYGQHDDQVDAMTQALNDFMKKPGLVIDPDNANLLMGNLRT